MKRTLDMLEKHFIRVHCKWPLQNLKNQGKKYIIFRLFDIETYYFQDFNVKTIIFSKTNT